MKKSYTMIVGATLLACAGLALTTAAARQAVAPSGAQAVPAQAVPAPPANPEEAAIRAVHEAFVKAYNAADVQTISGVLTDDAAVIDAAGDATRGKAEITAMYAESFKEAKGLKLESMAETVRFLTPDVAQVEGGFLLVWGDGDTAQPGKFAALAVRREGKWRLAELRDYPSESSDDVTPYDHLKELEWMVGDWIDEGANGSVRSSIRWAVNASFLIRTYSIAIEGEPSMDGTMMIGWDPQTGQIKSWVFDSEGGHGEGLWTRVADNKWVVKAHGVKHDGRPNSATQVHTIVSKDSVSTSSIDRIIGGETAADVVDVMMVRQPPRADPAPAPAAAPGQPAAPAAGSPK